MGYKPSPRPSYDAPTLLRFDEVTQHTWGDPGAGFVQDWIYVSSQLLHVIVFGMEPGGRFTHSESFRTIFGADELLYVLQGTLVLANPETGQVVRAGPGESVFFRKDTWHHGFSFGDEPVHVLEFFSPPPATGTSGPYAQAQLYLETSRYAQDGVVGNLLGATPAGRPADPASALTRGELRLLRQGDAVHRLDTGVLVGLLVSTEHLTVGTVTVPAGQESATETHDGEELVVCLRGSLQVRAGEVEATLGPRDAFFLPAGTPHAYRAEGGVAEGIFGVAPRYAVPG